KRRLSAMHSHEQHHILHPIGKNTTFLIIELPGTLHQLIDIRLDLWGLRYRNRSVMPPGSFRIEHTGVANITERSHHALEFRQIKKFIRPRLRTESCTIWGDLDLGADTHILRHKRLNGFETMRE